MSSHEDCFKRAGLPIKIVGRKYSCSYVNESNKSVSICGKIDRVIPSDTTLEIIPSKKIYPRDKNPVIGFYHEDGKWTVMLDMPIRGRHGKRPTEFPCEFIVN